jgi:hypothetical protein
MKMMNRVTQLSVAVGLGLAALIATAPASADAPRYQMLNLNYATVDYFLGNGTQGPYAQSFVVTLNPCDGTFSGDGVANIYGPSETDGLIRGARISYTTDYPVNGQTDYVVEVKNAVLAADYSFSGLWSDNWDGGPRVNEVVSAPAPDVTLASNWRNHGEFVAMNPDKNDAAHSCIGMPIVSKK